MKLTENNHQYIHSEVGEGGENTEEDKIIINENNTKTLTYCKHWHWNRL